MLLFTRKLDLINKNKQIKITVIGPAIKQNGLAISYVYFLSKILYIDTYRINFLFSNIRKLHYGQINVCDTKHIDRYTISAYYKHA